MGTVMHVFFDNISGDFLFSMKVRPSVTMLEMKQMIEKSLGFLVSKQTIFFKGKLLLSDNHNLQQCNIVDKSRLTLFCTGRRNHSYINQMRRQTRQASVPSSSTRGIFNVQDSSVYVGSRSKNQVQYQVPSSLIKDIINIEDSPEKITTYQDPTVVVGRSNEDQMFHQTNQQVSSVPSSSIGGLFFTEDQPVSVEHFMNIQSWPMTTEETINVEESQGSSKNQEFPARFGISYQDLVQAEKSQPREVIDVPDSPVRSSNKRPRNLRVMILANSPERRMFPVDVNESDNVEELRRELAKIPEINLPQGRYIFVLKSSQRPLFVENKSFRWNKVAYGDIIEIYPEYSTDN